MEPEKGKLSHLQFLAALLCSLPCCMLGSFLHLTPCIFGLLFILHAYIIPLHLSLEGHFFYYTMHLVGSTAYYREIHCFLHIWSYVHCSQKCLSRWCPVPINCFEEMFRHNMLYPPHTLFRRQCCMFPNIILNAQPMIPVSMNVNVHVLCSPNHATVPSSPQHLSQSHWCHYDFLSQSYISWNSTV